MNHKISVIYILLAGVFWGSSCIFVNELTAIGFSAMHCTAIRILFGAIILNAALIIKGRGFRLYRVSLPSLGITAACGVFSVLAMCIFYYSSMIRTTAAVSAILLYTAPIFVMIMSVIFFKERITTKKIVAFVVAITGCALVSGIVIGAQANLTGIILGVLSGFAYSLYGIFATFYMKKNSEPLTFAALNFIFASIAVIAIANVPSLVKITVSVNAPLSLIPLFAIFSLCTAVLPYFFYTKGLSGVRPDVASILAFVEPLTAALLGITVLKQPFDKYQAVGIALVVSAIVILNLNFKKREKKEQKNK